MFKMFMGRYAIYLKLLVLGGAVFTTYYVTAQLKDREHDKYRLQQQQNMAKVLLDSITAKQKQEVELSKITAKLHKANSNAQINFNNLFLGNYANDRVYFKPSSAGCKPATTSKTTTTTARDGENRAYCRPSEAFRRELYETAHKLKLCVSVHNKTVDWYNKLQKTTETLGQ